MYLERKQDEMVKAALSRKFAYLRRLKSVMKLLRENIAYKQDQRRKIIESDQAYKKAMLARFFTVLKKVDSMGKAREQKLISFLDNKRG